MRRTTNISAFSILELAVVLSLTGLFVSLFFLSVNSFNKSLQQEIAIKNELNTFFQFRSTFWLDLEKSDSFQLDENRLTCFLGKDFITYQIIDEKLSRSHKDHQALFEVNALAIEKTTLNKHDLIHFKLEWKNTEFSLMYPLQKQNINSINNYFNQRSWQK
ncbi:hypothetical protein [Fluviicola sp.]|uniref:hypothetical protein n=1 Tax=Fluviicola sp. TaxID=1917219 RepID=UPI003D2A0EF1